MWGPTGRLTPAGPARQPELRTVPRSGVRLEATADGTPLGLRLGEVPLVQKLAIKSVKLQFLISVVEPSGGAITVRLTPIR